MTMARSGPLANDEQRIRVVLVLCIGRQSFSSEERCGDYRMCSRARNSQAKDCSNTSTYVGEVRRRPSPEHPAPPSEPCVQLSLHTAAYPRLAHDDPLHPALPDGSGIPPVDRRYGTDGGAPHRWTAKRGS